MSMGMWNLNIWAIHCPRNPRNLFNHLRNFDTYININAYGRQIAAVWIAVWAFSPMKYKFFKYLSAWNELDFRQ